MRDLAADAATLRRLHHEDRPLVFANVWDAAGARAVAATGAPAVATSSAAVAAALGFEDGEAMPPDDAFDAVRRIAAAVEVPVSADIESGYGLGPEEVADRLVAAGAVGCNLEDTDHGGDRGALVDAEVHADRVRHVLAAGRRHGIELVINARVDVRPADGDGDGDGDASRAEIVRRGRLYLEAGATCVYPIFVSDEASIRALVKELPGPVNVHLRPGAPPLDVLRAIGVARVSVGSGAFRAAMGAVRSMAEDLRLP